jgi:hypothetical protein
VAPAASVEPAAAAPPRVGLGTGKAAVAVQLSDDDSDGELPDIVDEDDE